VKKTFEVVEIGSPPRLELHKQVENSPSELQAWDWSLLKWKLLHHHCAEGNLVHDGGRQTCGLCSLFFFGHSDECEDCPIKIEGHPGCQGTPYRDYLSAVEKGDLALAKLAARQEVEFLRSFHMGLDYNYRLFFHRNQTWEVLQGVVALSLAHEPTARIHFPDHMLTIPLDTWGPRTKKDFQHDDPEFSFAIVMNFETDAAIRLYLEGRDADDEDGDRSPPDKQSTRVDIGFIYLTMEQELETQEGLVSDMVLFDFSTTGTLMSILFEESTSIRQAFLGLLERHQGVYGVFNRELSGEVFWVQGRKESIEVKDSFMLPSEMEEIRKRGW
jgi:hypothetical protein